MKILVSIRRGFQSWINRDPEGAGGVIGIILVLVITFSVYSLFAVMGWKTNGQWG